MPSVISVRPMRSLAPPVISTGFQADVCACDINGKNTTTLLKT
jgi:hypothetical protein